MDRIPEAIDAIEPALAIHIAEGDTWGEAVARTMLAMAHHSLGHADEALPDLHRALDIYRNHGDQRNVAGNMSNLGLVYGSLGQTEQAIEYQLRRVPMDAVARPIDLVLADTRRLADSFGAIDYESKKSRGTDD